MPNTAASCCSSSIGSCDTELRAVASSCMVVSAPATAPRTSQPATLSFTPMKDPLIFRPDAAVSVDRSNCVPSILRQANSEPAKVCKVAGVLPNLQYATRTAPTEGPAVAAPPAGPGAGRRNRLVFRLVLRPNRRPAGAYARGPIGRRSSSTGQPEMNPVADCEAAPAVGRGPALLGLARLMKMAFDGIDLKPVAGRLIERAAADAADANALLDLSTVLMLQGLGELGLATQTQALQVRRDYELAAAGAPALRLLAIMAPGDLMTNMPLPFLLEGSGVSLHMLYVAPGEPLPSLLPLHDLVLIAVSESDRTAPLLRQLAAAPAWSRPLCNRPAAIAGTSRSLAHARLAGAPGVAMPVAARAGRDRLRLVAGGATPLPSVLPEGRFPLVVRPVDSHAGHGLEKVDDGRALGRYLDAATADEFFVSRFIDY